MRELTVCEIDCVSGGSAIAAALAGIGAIIGGGIGTVGGLLVAAVTGLPAYLAAAPIGVGIGAVAGFAVGAVIGIIV